MRGIPVQDLAAKRVFARQIYQCIAADRSETTQHVSHTGDSSWKRIPALPRLFFDILSTTPIFLIPFFAIFIFIDFLSFRSFSTVKHRRRERRGEGDQELLAERRIYVEGGELIVARLERNTVAKVLANGH